MKQRDHTTLLADLAEAYRERTPKSATLHERAQRVLVDGGSHTLRLHEPFPPRIVAAQGGWVRDEDGHDILDFWQGHLANVLGHNPTVLTSALAEALHNNWGLQTGFSERIQVEAAEILCRQTGAERARFTTSGTLATMYAIMLAQSFTGQELVMKVGGGWHGAHPWGLKGVHLHPGRAEFQQMDSAGLPAALTDAVLVTRFNDPDQLRHTFSRYGDQLACFILEPVVGGGGLIPATLDYVRTARELTRRYGAVLILDEVITGFRFRAGDAGALYDVQPDLATFGKAIGGGMPVSAVTGRAEILALAARGHDRHVGFSGGTYSAHPAAMLAARTVMTYLADHEAEVYPHLADLGQKARRAVEEAFSEEGICARCTGYGNEALPGSSLFKVHFPYESGATLRRPGHVSAPSVCDTVLGEEALQVALLLEDVYLLEGHGAVAVAHTEADIEKLDTACRRVARRFRSHLIG